MLQHLGGAGNPTKHQSVYRSRANAIDADFLWAKVVSQITSARFQGGLGDSHDIVVWNDLFRAVIGHRDDATAVGHEWSGGAGERNQRIGADIMGDPKGLAGGIDEFALERVLWRKSHR